MKPRNCYSLIFFLILSCCLNAQPQNEKRKKRKKDKDEEEKTLFDMTKEEINDSLYTLEMGIAKLQSELAGFNRERTKLQVQLRRIDTFDRKKAIEGQNIKGNQKIVIDSIKKVNGFKHMFMVIEVFDKKYEKSIRFISDKFYCQSDNRALKAVWRKRFKSVIENSENIWDFYNGINNSRVEIYQYTNERELYIKLNNIKSEKKTNSNLRTIIFSPKCDTPEQILEKTIRESEELEQEAPQ